MKPKCKKFTERRKDILNSTKDRREWWIKLKQHHKNKDVKGFYKEYAKYLEWEKIISDKRKILYEMAIMAVAVLNE